MEHLLEEEARILNDIYEEAFNVRPFIVHMAVGDYWYHQTRVHRYWLERLKAATDEAEKNEAP